jgi:ribosomal protein S27AE
MGWDDVNDVLFEGSKKRIEELLCPDCGGFLEYHYSSSVKEMTLKCTGKCGHLEKMHGLPEVPNCATLLGNHKIIKPEKTIQ